MRVEDHGLGSAIRWLSALLLLTIAFAQKAEAHPRDPVRGPNQGEAIPVGPFEFSPPLLISWQHRDNIFFSPDDPVADQLYLAWAWLWFELPIYESYVKFSHSPQFRDYKDYNLEEKWSRFVDLDGNFEFSSGLVLDADYRFVRGNCLVRCESAASRPVRSPNTSSSSSRGTLTSTSRSRWRSPSTSHSRSPSSAKCSAPGPTT